MSFRCSKVCLVAAVAAFSYAPAHAAIFTLADVGQNSSMEYDTSSGDFYAWNVEGLNYLYQRGYFFRIGNSPEVKVNGSNLTLANTKHYNSNFLPGNEALAVRYLDPAGGFSITINTVLTAGAVGSNQATFTESVRIDNLGQSPLAMTLFLYADYDLASSAIDDSLVFGDKRSLTQSHDGVVHELAATVDTSHIEASYFSSLLTSLTDGSPTTLNDNGSLFNGDLVYGLQWNLVIPALSSFTLGNSNSLVVPEFYSMGLLGAAACGVSAFAFLRRRK
jgi:hypothetical protein